MALAAAQVLDGISGTTLGVLTALVVADLTKGTGRFNLAQGFVGTMSGVGASLSTTLSSQIAGSRGRAAGFLGIWQWRLPLLLLWLLMPETNPSNERPTGRGVTDQLAEAGYIAIAPDLLSGAAANGGGTSDFKDGDAVRKAISSLPADQVTADLNAAVEYVAKLPACNGKVVVAGFCWGGGQSFRLATDNKDIKAAFVFYGTGPDKEEPIGRIKCPIYGFYAGNDARVNATIDKTTELMKAAKKTYEPAIYEGAGHGFMRRRSARRQRSEQEGA